MRKFIGSAGEFARTPSVILFVTSLFASYFLLEYHYSPKYLDAEPAVSPAGCPAQSAHGLNSSAGWTNILPNAYAGRSCPFDNVDIIIPYTGRREIMVLGYLFRSIMMFVPCYRKVRVEI
jgi:hypothetical protein